MVDTKQKTGDFKTLSFAEAFATPKSHYFISKQSITQDNGSTGIFLVLKKQAMNEDGSPRGQSRQIFIDFDDSSKVLKYALDWMSKDKK